MDPVDEKDLDATREALERVEAELLAERRARSADLDLIMSALPFVPSGSVDGVPESPAESVRKVVAELVGLVEREHGARLKGDAHPDLAYQVARLVGVLERGANEQQRAVEMMGPDLRAEIEKAQQALYQAEDKAQRALYQTEEKAKKAAARAEAAEAATEKLVAAQWVDLRELDALVIRTSRALNIEENPYVRYPLAVSFDDDRGFILTADSVSVSAPTLAAAFVAWVATYSATIEGRQKMDEKRLVGLKGPGPA